MAYKITLETRLTGGPVDVDVPEEVAKDLTELYGALRTMPKNIAHAVFDTADEKDVFIAQAKTWGRQQTPALEVRVSPTRKNKLPANEVNFNIRPVDVAAQAEEPRGAVRQ